MVVDSVYAVRTRTAPFSEDSAMNRPDGIRERAPSVHWPDAIGFDSLPFVSLAAEWSFESLTAGTGAIT